MAVFYCISRREGQEDHGDSESRKLQISNCLTYKNDFLVVVTTEQMFDLYWEFMCPHSEEHPCFTKIFVGTSGGAKIFTM